MRCAPGYYLSSFQPCRTGGEKPSHTNIGTKLDLHGVHSLVKFAFDHKSGSQSGSGLKIKNPCAIGQLLPEREPRSLGLSQYLNPVETLQEISDCIVGGRGGGIPGGDARLEIAPRLQAEVILELHLIRSPADAVPRDGRKIRLDGNRGVGTNRNGPGIGRIRLEIQFIAIKETVPVTIQAKTPTHPFRNNCVSQLVADSGQRSQISR